MDFVCRGLLPMSVSHGLRPMSHCFGFDGTLTTLLCSIQHFLLFDNESWSIPLIPIFHPLIYTALPILPDIPVTSAYPHFYYSYLLYQYLPTSNHNSRYPVL